jgi:BTB/POZ domain
VQGRFFIDRSPDYFGYVLDFLRGHEVELPSDPRELRLLWNEADFYGLEGLKELIPRQPNLPLKLPQPAFNFFGHLLKGEEKLVMALDNVLSSIPPFPFWALLLRRPSKLGKVSDMDSFYFGFMEVWAGEGVSRNRVVLNSNVYITSSKLPHPHGYSSSDPYNKFRETISSWVRLHLLN